MNIKPFKIKISQTQLDDLAGCDQRANYGGPELANMKDLTRKALSLPFEDLSIANVADRKVNATKLGIHTADA